MSTLGRKLLRDLARLKEQALAIALVMACGIATFVMSLSMIDSLRGTLEAYYDSSRFADLFAQARRAPANLEDRIRAIPGVAAVECRVVEGALLDVPGALEPVSARIVSLPPDPASGLNAVHLRSGRLPEGRDNREALVNERFAQAHALAPGDSITAILNGRLEQVRIVGVALSPEFIFLIPPGGILPEHGRHAVFWMSRDEAEAAFDMDGAFNDVLVRLAPRALPADVIASLDALLARYGGTGAYTREDHPSHEFVANELAELRGMTMVAPSIFLGVAAFLVNLVLGRLIATQREQVAALRALGYTRVEVARHYLAFTLAISLVASVLGILLGAWMGRGLTGLYADFFAFPRLDFRLPPRVIAIGMLTGPLAGALAAAGALRAVMRLAPAEAMRAPAPTNYHPTLLERLGLHRALPISIRMVVRYLERRPLRTALSALGVALATAVLVVGSYTGDAVDYLLDFQFNRVQRRDVELVMNEETDESVVADARHLPGVLAAEPYRSVPVRLRNGRHHRRTGILALDRPDGMHHLLSMYAQEIDLPDHGVVLSSSLARLLDLRPGDDATVEVLAGRRPVFQAPVADLIDDFSGLAAYMDLRELNRLMREPGTVSGVYLRTDAPLLPDLYREIRRTPVVMGVNVKALTQQSFRATISRNLSLMRSFLVAFSTVIAVGVIYNAARVSLSERGRDLATLRVIGFTRGEVAAVQLGELALVTLLGLPAGLALGYALARLTSAATASELFRIPFIIHASTFGFAAVIVLGASVLSGVAIARRAARLDPSAVLKARE